MTVSLPHRRDTCCMLRGERRERVEATFQSSQRQDVFRAWPPRTVSIRACSNHSCTVSSTVERAPGTWEYRSHQRSKTFALLRDVGGYGFCKTGFSEIAKYDLIVKATLIVAGDRAPGCYRIASDGFDFEGAGAAAWASEVLGRRPPQPSACSINCGRRPSSSSLRSHLARRYQSLLWLIGRL